MILFVGSSAAVTSPSCVTASGTTTCTYSYTGAEQSFTVPAGVTSATFSAYGAKGGIDGDFHPGGLGARATATIAVSPGSMIEVDVGGRGVDGTLTGVSGAGGFNGGGAGGASVGDASTDNAPAPGGGGGASDLRMGTCAATSSCGLDARVLVGGGGGGAGAAGTIDTQGGGGGYPAGGDGHDVDPTRPFLPRTAGGGSGGTQSTGGPGGAGESGCGETAGGTGAAGTGGQGGNAQTDATKADGGGGGGGGYYGGGGGGGGCQGDEGGGGGGGSSFGPNDATFDNAVGSGDGLVTISYEEPTTPDLTITKTHTGDFTQGQRGDYTITVTNSGSAPTSGTVTVTDALPSGLATNVVASSNVWGCTGSTSTVMTCTRTTALAAGDSSAITLTVGVASDAQSVTNTASVSGGGETNTANDSASDPTTVIDATPPNTAITAHPSDPNNNASQSFSFSGDDGGGGSGVASFECKLDAASFAACTSPQSYSGLSDGSHTFQVRAIDAAGNVDPSPASYSWTVDLLPPQTFIDGNPSDPSNDSFARFHYRGIDNHTDESLLSFECKLDDSAFAPCPLDLTSYSGLLDGSHTFQVRATDAAGNVQQLPATFTWTVDTTAPTDTPQLSGTLGSNGWYTTSVVVAWHWTDGGGSGIDSSHCTQTTTSSGDGSSVMVLSSCRDLAGNTSSDSRSFKIDTTKPQLAPTLSTSSIALNQPGVTASPGATDSGGSGVASSSCGAISTSSVGDHTVTCTATDNAGNANSSTIHYTVGYKFGGFTSPLPKTTVQSGSTLPIKFQLQDAAGHPISDTAAQSLISPTCKIAIILVKPAGPVSGCPTYSTTLKQFQFNLKTTNAMKGANGVSITVTVGGTIVTASAPPDPFTVK